MAAQANMIQSADTINFSWLIRLRWGAIVGQALLILIASQVFSIDLHLWALTLVLSIAIFTNIFASLLLTKKNVSIKNWSIAILVLDTLLLTTILYFSGGPFNPFNFLYLVHITLAAIILPVAWTWVLVGLAFCCFGLLFLQHIPLMSGTSVHPGMHEGFHFHLYGMWIAFGVASIFIVYFVQRLIRALAERDQEVATLKRREAFTEKLSALATLSAGAAHELSTPLSTIAVISKELERQLKQMQPDLSESICDSQMIRQEVKRCQEILRQMSLDSGQMMGESLKEITLNQLLEETRAFFGDSKRVILKGVVPSILLNIPAQALTTALRALIKNALQASKEENPVFVDAKVEGKYCKIEIEDQGKGMTPEVLESMGSPFFTTKTPGEGMGLGVFLSRSIIERLGGNLEYRSVAGVGTRATVSFSAQLKEIHA